MTARALGVRTADFTHHATGRFTGCGRRREIAFSTGPYRRSWRTPLHEDAGAGQRRCWRADISISPPWLARHECHEWGNGVGERKLGSTVPPSDCRRGAFAEDRVSRSPANPTRHVLDSEGVAAR